VVAVLFQGSLRIWDRRPRHRPEQLVGFQAWPSRRASGRIPAVQGPTSRHGLVRFSTGALRLEPDRRHLTLPVIGRLRSKESTRRLERLLTKGRARVLSMTLSELSGRLFVSVATVVAQLSRRPSEPDARCGIDLGIGAEWAVVAHAGDMIERITHPAPWAAVQQQRRCPAWRLSRRVVGSRGHRQAKAKLAALDRRTANLRRESIHTLTTRLARRYGTIVVEDLDVAAMGKGMGRRAFRRSVYQAGLGRGGYLADLRLGQRVWVCPVCGQLVDRNANAALNLHDWTGPVSDRGCPAGWSCRLGAARGRPRRAGSRFGCGRARPCKTTVRGGVDDTTTNPRTWGAEPRTGVSGR
jgi:transposase